MRCEACALHSLEGLEAPFLAFLNPTLHSSTTHVTFSDLTSIQSQCIRRFTHPSVSSDLCYSSVIRHAHPICVMRQIDLLPKLRTADLKLWAPPIVVFLVYANVVSSVEIEINMLELGDDRNCHTGQGNFCSHNI